MITNAIHPSTFARAGLLVLLLVTAAAAQGPPQVTKVEPPSWWAGHSLNPVRVLLRGRNLAGARVEVMGAGLRASNVRTNAAGTYLFADINIAPTARPGVRILRV